MPTSFFNCASCLVGNRCLSMTLIATSRPLSRWTPTEFKRKLSIDFRRTNLFGDYRNFRAWNWMISETLHFYKQHFWREWGRDLNAGGMFDRWEPAKGKQKEQWIGLGNCWSTQTWNRFQYFPAHGSGFMATTDYMWHDMYMFSQAACFAVSEYM